MTAQVTLTAEQRESLRTAALTEAAGNLRAAAEALDLAASDPGPVTLADAATASRIVRDDLDAIEALEGGGAS